MDNPTKLIGVCGANLFEQNSIQFLSALREIACKKNYTTIAFSMSIESSDDSVSPIADLELLELCKYIDLECIILLIEPLMNPYAIQRIVEIGALKNIPVFAIDGVIEGCYGMPLDYKNAFANMVRHVLKKHNVTCVNMMAGMINNPFSDERIQVFKDVLAECGVPFDERRLEYGDFWSRPTRAAMQRILDSDLPMPEAIICANDEMAMTVCATLAEHGYKVPEDIIVTGFDGTQSAKHHFPSITTCIPDYNDAIEFILAETAEVKATGIVSPQNRMINFNVAKRQSCGCEPNTIHNNSRLVSDLYAAVGDASWHSMAMNSLVTSTLDKGQIDDVVKLLPEAVRMWNHHFRFACIKSELMAAELDLAHCKDATGPFDRMTTILYLKDRIFDESHAQFDVKEFIPNFDTLITRPGTTFVARILKNGSQVYGYSVDEFDTLEHRRLQRCNEFAMFLTHSINTVLHNFQLTELNHNLEKANAEIEALSVHDPLTGIYNRRGFFHVLADSLRTRAFDGQYLYVVNVDLDGLKYINDNFGHKEGDFAITTVAHALDAIQGDHLICSRFGGDEFTCTFISDQPDLYSTEQIKEQIISAMFLIPDVTRKEYPLDFSIGVCTQQITPDINIENIISAADDKMYADKAAHKRAQKS